jgi:hypothetical protein
VGGCEAHNLNAVVKSEFGIQVLGVSSDRIRADAELPSDFSAVTPSRQEPQDLHLARGEGSKGVDIATWAALFNLIGRGSVQPRQHRVAVRRRFDHAGRRGVYAEYEDVRGGRPPAQSPDERRRAEAWHLAHQEDARRFQTRSHRQCL